MDKESLIVATKEIIEALDKADINLQDKAELMLNLTHFLDEEKYKKNIKILMMTKGTK